MSYQSEYIKSNISMRNICDMYGVDVNGFGYTFCPFHSERTASMKIYENGYKCYGCNKGGDGISFVMGLFKLTFIEAINKIENDFKIVTHQTKETEMSEWQKKNIERKIEKKKQEVLWNEYLKLKIIIETLFPVMVENEEIIYSSKWIDAVNKIDFIEHEMGII